MDPDTRPEAWCANRATDCAACEVIAAHKFEAMFGKFLDEITDENAGLCRHGVIIGVDINDAVDARHLDRRSDFGRVAIGAGASGTLDANRQWRNRESGASNLRSWLRSVGSRVTGPVNSGSTTLFTRYCPGLSEVRCVHPCLRQMLRKMPKTHQRKVRLQIGDERIVLATPLS